MFVQEAAPAFAASLESALDLAITYLKQFCDQVICDAVRILQTLQGRAFQTIVSLVGPKEPLSVICHGDFWINNLRFSVDSEVVVTDVQMVRHSSLAIDLLHFMYSSLEPDLLRDYSDVLIQSYHRSLSDTVSKLAAPLPSLRDIQYELESHALYGLLMSFLLLPNTVSSDNPTPDKYSLCTCSYTQRIKEIILKFVENGFI